MRKYLFCLLIICLCSCKPTKILDHGVITAIRKLNSQEYKYELTVDVRNYYSSDGTIKVFTNTFFSIGDTIQFFKTNTDYFDEIKN